MKKSILAKEPLLLVGPPGGGKTDLITQVTKLINHKFIVIYPVLSEPPDFKGYPVYDPATGVARFVPFDVLKELVETTEPTVALMDDFGQANNGVQAACMHLFRARRVGEHQLSPHVTFVIATNDKTHHAGVGGVLEPVKSRVLSIITMTVDLEDWLKWALENDIAPEVIGYMRLRGHKFLSDFKPSTGLTNSPSPRAQEAVSKIVKMKFPAKIEHELIQGAAGEAYATDIRGFLHLYRNLPDPEAVLRDPDNVTIPKDAAIMWAYCSAIAAVATPDKMTQIVKFAAKLPDDYQIKLLAYDCKYKDPLNHETAAYITWAIQNQHLVKVA